MNDQVKAFRDRRLEKTYPVLWVDALYERIRYDNRVINMAVEVVIGIDMQGKRDILAIEPMQEESESTYKSLFDSLKARGLEDVWLVVSDAHKGLTKAIRESFVGCAWQRCKVHLMRNILARIPSKEKTAFASRLKQVWLQPDIDTARTYADRLIDDYENRFPEAARILEEGLEDSLQFYSFHRMDARKISSTNILERLNREIRRRTNVVGVFPNMDSYIRLVTSHLIEYSEDWSAGKAYIHPEKIALIQEKRLMAA